MRPCSTWRRWTNDASSAQGDLRVRSLSDLLRSLRKAPPNPVYMTRIMYNVKWFRERRAPVRVTREPAAAHREKILDVAGTLFRERGFDGIGVAAIMKQAGLTHGGFFGHFKSKDDLAAEITGRGLGRPGWLEGRG